VEESQRPQHPRQPWNPEDPEDALTSEHLAAASLHELTFGRPKAAASSSPGPRQPSTFRLTEFLNAFGNI
jgi:hypothetical protein